MSSTLLVEIVEGPVTCCAEDCPNDSGVFITCEEFALDKSPHCTGHAHVVMAEYMVGI